MALSVGEQAKIVSRPMSRKTVEQFNKEWFGACLQFNMYYRGRHLAKNPCDMWQMLELLWDTQPELIVETGTFLGASALFYAEQTELLYGGADVVSIDIEQYPGNEYPQHPRLRFCFGRSSIDPEVLELVRGLADGVRTMVILDSNHAKAHVLAELERYAPLVSVGCYLVVEDTNVNGHPVMSSHGDGPWEAVKAWQPTNHGFERDRQRERFGLTFHPSGWLKRVR